jgi:hypothetical protein
MRGNAAEVTLVPRNIFFLKTLNFVQSFVECKVSLADGIYRFHRFTGTVHVTAYWRIIYQVAHILRHLLEG